MNLPGWFMDERIHAVKGPTGIEGPGFVEKNLRAAASFMKGVFEPEEYAKRRGLLQSLDPRARILGFFFLVTGAAVTGQILMLAAPVLVAALLSWLSSIPLRAVARRVLPSFVFTLVVVLPVSLSLLSPGPELAGVDIGGYRIAVTRTGLFTCLHLLARVTSMVAVLSLLFLATTQPDLFKGLKGLHIPAFFVTALFMTFRYIFILLGLVEDSSLAMKSRTISRAAVKGARGWFASRVAFFLERSLKVAEDVNMAMASRGFTGDIRTMDEYSMKGRDYCYLGATSFFFFLSLGL